MSSYHPPVRSSSVRPVVSQSNRRPQTAPDNSAQRNPAAPDGLLALQQSVGNQALQRMLAKQGVQPKLTVGASNDKYEQEADQVAADVTSDAPGQAQVEQPGFGAVQRQGLTPLKSPATSTYKSNKDNSAGQVQRSGGGDSFQASGSFEGALAHSKGGGRQLSGETRSEMESKFGVSFGGVRVHTGPQAVQLSRSVNAEAFTHGQDIFMNKDRFEPGTKPGKQLLAHELTHVVQQTGGVQRKQGAISGGMTMNRISRKKSLRRLDFIKMKRKETHIVKMLLSKVKLAKKPDDAYGHWWTELGGYSKGGDWSPTESYGWWPSQGVDIKSTLGGVPGKLNGVGHFEGTATKDPHHGEAAGEFNPAMMVDDSVDSKAFRNETMGKVRSFATSFRGSWNWRFGWGKNCHTFQERMMKSLGMKKANGAAKIDTGDMESHAGGDKAELSLASWNKLKARFEEYNGLEFVNIDNIMVAGQIEPEDFYAALADVEASEQEARINELLSHNTGVTAGDLEQYKKR
jgi:Domain of unknown function (DUF4157)